MVGLDSCVHGVALRTVTQICIYFLAISTMLTPPSDRSYVSQSITRRVTEFTGDRWLLRPDATFIPFSTSPLEGLLTPNYPLLEGFIFVKVDRKGHRGGVEWNPAGRRETRGVVGIIIGLGSNSRGVGALLAAGPMAGKAICIHQDRRLRYEGVGRGNVVQLD